jgi:hypothetical protein
MKSNYLKFLIPLWVVGILIYVYVSPGEYKLVPILAVLFMGAGFWYALVRFLRSNTAEHLPQKPLDITDFERKVKIAKPLRIVGMSFLILQLLVWLEVFRFRYDESLSLLVIVFLLAYILALVIFGRRQVNL